MCNLAIKINIFTYAITVIFDIFSCNISAFFQLFFSAVYALKIELSVLTFRPCLDSDHQRLIIYKAVSTTTVRQISYQEIITGSQVLSVGRMVQLNKFAVAESLLSNQ